MLKDHMKKHVLGSTLLFIVGLFFATAYAAQVPLLVNYQGKIEVTGVPFDGQGYFKFSLIDDPITTTANYWVNDGGTIPAGSEPTSSSQIPVSQGLYSIQLGNTNLSNMTALTPGIFSNNPVYLRVWFSTNGATFEQLSPDRQLVSTPFAFQAENAANLDAAATVPASQINTTGASNLVSKLIAGAGISLNPVSGVGDVTITSTGGGGGGAASDVVCTNCVDASDINGGSGSGVDADLLDGSDSTAFATAAHSHASAEIIDGTIVNVDISATAAIAASKIADGSGSGLDADLLDGSDSTAFAAAAHNHSGSDITTGSVAIGQGGTGATTASVARTNLGASASGANADITSMTALTSVTRATGGAFNVNTGNAAGDDVAINTSALVVEGDTANVGVGTAAPGAKLEVAGQVKITGGTPGAGKLLSSDATGLASWQPLTFPFLATPVFTADGQAAVESTTDALAIRAGSGVAGGVPANTAVDLPLIQQKDITLMQPNLMQAVSDVIPFISVDSYNYPGGIVITAIKVSTSDATTTLSIDIEKWATPTATSPGLGVIDTVATSTSDEAIDTAIADGVVPVGSYVMLNLDTTVVNWLKVTIWYYVP